MTGIRMVECAWCGHDDHSLSDCRAHAMSVSERETFDRKVSERIAAFAWLATVTP